MLWIAVCDDEVMECSIIAGKIKRILKEMNVPCVIRQFYSGRELLQASERFDFIFLDIMMKDLDGMETARIFRERAFDKILIFISASREYVFEAYDVEAFQYILKPVDEKKLRNVLEKAVLKTQAPSQKGSSLQEFMIVSKEREKRKLFLDEIYYFEIMGRTVDVHERNGVFTYYEQIGVLEKRLQGKDFFRCHKSYLINLKYVAAYNRQEVILDNGERIGIAKRRYEEFCREILAYMRKSGGIN